MDVVEILRIVFALLAVIGMIGLAALAARKFGLASGGFALQRARRIALVETLAIDAKRRAAILACDGREHLIILDPAGVAVVEQDLPPRPAADEAPNFAEPPAPKKLAAPSAVARFFKGPPRDETMAFRAAGVL